MFYSIFFSFEMVSHCEALTTVKLIITWTRLVYKLQQLYCHWQLNAGIIGIHCCAQYGNSIRLFTINVFYKYSNNLSIIYISSWKSYFLNLRFGIIYKWIWRISPSGISLSQYQQKLQGLLWKTVHSFGSSEQLLSKE